MRSLAYPPWTAEQVGAKVAARTGRILSRFEVRDLYGHPLGIDLPVLNEPGAQLVEANLDQEIVGGARLTMLPVEELRDRALNVFVWAWWGIEMEPDRWAWFPMGVYMWQPPERTIVASGVETWQVALPDPSMLMELSTVGAAGWRVTAGTKVSTAWNRLLAESGFPEWARVPEIDEPITRTLWWAPRTPRRIQALEDVIQVVSGVARRKIDKDTSAKDRAKIKKARKRVVWLKRKRRRFEIVTGRTTRWQIARELGEAVGFEPPVFGWGGVPETRPVRDVRVDRPDVSYSSERDGLLMLPLTSKPDLTEFRNRVIVSPQASTTETRLTEAVADLNTLMPRHPFAQRNLAHGGKGFYIDEWIQDDLAFTQGALLARAKRELLSRLKGYQEVAFSSMLNPAHEPHDVVAMRLDGDAELGSVQSFLSRRLAVDLFDGTVTHQHARVFGVAGLFEAA